MSDLSEIRKKYNYKYSASEISALFFLFKIKELDNFDKFINEFEKSKLSIENVKIYNSVVRVSDFLVNLKKE
jgi:hypothetical protein